MKSLTPNIIFSRKMKGIDYQLNNNSDNEVIMIPIPRIGHDRNESLFRQFAAF